MKGRREQNQRDGGKTECGHLQRGFVPYVPGRAAGATKMEAQLEPWRILSCKFKCCELRDALIGGLIIQGRL